MMIVKLKTKLAGDMLTEKEGDTPAAFNLSTRATNVHYGGKIERQHRAAARALLDA